MNDRTKQRESSTGLLGTIVALPAWSILAMTCMTSVARAQTTSAGDARAQLEEVIVTASKTGAQSIQDIPLNISAVGAVDLVRANAVGLEDLTRLVPGVAVSAGKPNDQLISIRGLRSTNSAQVNIYLDEIPLADDAGVVRQADVGLYDLERVEVLRGPQGTLYGAGSQGGTIRYITNKPDATGFDASVATTIGARSRGERESLQFNGMVNVPLVSDALALRAVAYRRDIGGYVDLPELNLSDMGDQETTGGRLLLKWDVGENTTLEAAGFYEKTTLDDDTQVLPDVDARTRGGLSTTSAVLQPTSNELRMYSLTLDHRLGFGTLTATASQFERDAFRSQNQSNRAPFPLRLEQPAEVSQFSSEVRFASDLDGPLQLLIGAFHTDRDLTYRNEPRRADVTTGQGTGAPVTVQINDTDQSNDAIFANATLQLNDRFSVEGGVRSYRMKFDFTQTFVYDLARFSGQIIPIGSPPLVSTLPTAKESGQVYRAQLNYKPSRDFLTYLTYSEGFRPGAANDVTIDPDPITPPNVPAAYQSDFVKNHELGWKSTWLDQQLTFNGALYYMRWEDIQVGVRLPGALRNHTDNAGEAELLGVELEGRIRPAALPGFTVGFGARWSDQYLTQDSPLVNPPAPAVPNPYAGRDGEQIPYANHYGASLNIEQAFPLGRHDSYARVDASYSSEAFTTFTRADPFDRKLPSYVLLNARVGMTVDAWEFALYARNLTDVREPTNWFVETAGTGLPDRVVTTASREIGLAASYHFGGRQR